MVKSIVFDSPAGQCNFNARDALLLLRARLKWKKPISNVVVLKANLMMTKYLSESGFSAVESLSGKQAITFVESTLLILLPAKEEQHLLESRAR